MRTQHIVLDFSSFINRHFSFHCKCHEQKGLKKMGNLSTLTTARRLEGKVALITGAASGIGYATAVLFHNHGAKVIVTDIQDELGRKVADEMNSGNDNAIYVHCEVTSEDDIRNAVDVAVAKYGKLDIMFNNAGITMSKPSRSVIEYSRREFEMILDVNLVGMFLGAKHAARVMLPARKGCIIFNGSASTVTGGLTDHAYCASKHAVVGLTRNMAVELGQFGIRVNCMSPFLIKTAMFKTCLEGIAMYDELMSKCENLKGVNFEAKDVAEAALYLASDESRYVSGHNLIVDGGFTICDSAYNLFKM